MSTYSTNPADPVIGARFVANVPADREPGTAGHPHRERHGRTYTVTGRHTDTFGNLRIRVRYDGDHPTKTVDHPAWVLAHDTPEEA